MTGAGGSLLSLKSRQKGCPLTQNQRIRPYFSFTFCRSRSPESFGPVLAPKLAPRPPTKPSADKQTNKQENKQTDAEPRITPRPPTRTLKRLTSHSGGQTACPPSFGPYHSVSYHTIPHYTNLTHTILYHTIP